MNIALSGPALLQPSTEDSVAGNHQKAFITPSNARTIAIPTEVSPAELTRPQHPIRAYYEPYTTAPFGEEVALRGYNAHTGTDYGVHGRTDIPTNAIYDGVVVFAGPAYHTTHSGCGVLVAVYHEHLGITSGYCHLSAVWVEVGQTVSSDTFLGVIGTTGLSTGIHLHFMITAGNDYFNRNTVLNSDAWLADNGLTI